MGTQGIMKLDEFAFLNQQLAGMLESGMPLEGALHELCESTARGELKTEFAALEKDLAAGSNLTDALAARNLPDLYRQALQAGAKANDLPTVLNTLAAHYSRIHAIWERVRGILVYPAIVMLIACAISVGVGLFITNMIFLFAQDYPTHGWFNLHDHPAYSSRAGMLFEIWMPTAALTAITVTAFLLMWWPPTRARLNWRLPALRDVQLANFASSMSLLLSGGITLPDSLKLMGANHSTDPLGPELDQWHRRLAAGNTSIALTMKSSSLVPPMFAWAVASSGSDLAGGFAKAAELYHRQARYRTELMLNILLPITILIMGVIIVTQASPLFRMLGIMMDVLGS